MFQITQSTATKVRVTLMTSGGQGLTGITYSQVTCYLQKYAGASAQKVLAGADWTEIDAASMPGEYDLSLSAADTNIIGWLRYDINAPGAVSAVCYEVQVTTSVGDVATPNPLRTRVTLIGPVGTGLTGVLYSQVTVYLQKYAQAAVQKIMGAGDWFEIDATNLPGEYDLLLSNTNLSTTGFLRYSVANASAVATYIDQIAAVASIGARPNPR